MSNLLRKVNLFTEHCEYFIIHSNVSFVRTTLMLLYFGVKGCFCMVGLLMKVLSIGLILFGFIGETTLVHAESNSVTDYEISPAFIKYEAPDMDLSLATDEQIKQLEEIGWNLDADVPFLLIERKSGVKTVDSKVVKAEVINLSDLLDDHQNEHSNDNFSEPIISPFVITYGIYNPPAHGTKIYKNGDPVHCNRFNGPNSDGRHLDKWKAQTYINYYGSDCFYGVNSGICTYTNDKCNTSLVFHRGWCSFQQGWSVYYHQR